MCFISENDEETRINEEIKKILKGDVYDRRVSVGERYKNKDKRRKKPVKKKDNESADEEKGKKDEIAEDFVTTVSEQMEVQITDNAETERGGTFHIPTNCWFY